ncbi:MAG: tetracycline resistance MFS efflux pump [Microscillaceae bacterium]
MWKNRKLMRIYAIVLVDIMAGSIIWPAYPQFVAHTSQPALYLALGTAFFIGIQWIAAPLLGKFSDYYGRRPVFILSAFGTLGANLMLLPRNVWAYWSNHASDGFTNGVYAAVRASITDISPEKDLGRNIGIEGTIVSIGFVLGPMLAAGVLTLLKVDESQSALVLIFTGLSLSLLNVFICWFFEETLPQPAPTPARWWKTLLANSLSVRGHLVQLQSLNRERPGLFVTVVLQLCLTLALGYYHYFIPFLSLSRLQMNPAQISWFFVYFGLISILVNSYFYGYLIYKINVQRFIPPVALLGLFTLMAYAWAEQSLVWLYVIVTIDCLTLSLLPGLMDGLIAEYTKNEDRGTLFGLTQALNGLASFCTTLVFGGLAMVSLTAPFYWFGLCLLPLIFSYRLFKT